MSPSRYSFRLESGRWLTALERGEFPEVLAVGVFVAGGEFVELGAVDEVHAVGDFLDAGDFEALALFDGFDVVGGLDEGFGGAGVEPGEAAAEAFDAELVAMEVFAIDVGDFEFAAG